MLIEKSVWDYIKVMKLDLYMIGHKGFIAGGCFKNIFMNEKIKDIDIFFENDTDRADAESYYDSNEDYYEYYKNDKVKAYKHRHNQTQVELVKTVYGTPEEILNNFDFTVAKFAYFKKREKDEDGEEKTTYKCLIHENFFEHLALKRTVLDDKIPFPVSTFERMIRYTNYGFYPCRETKKKLIEAIYALPELPDVSMGLYNGLD
jgi:hypothetical protein